MQGFTFICKVYVKFCNFVFFILKYGINADRSGSYYYQRRFSKKILQASKTGDHRAVY